MDSEQGRNPETAPAPMTTHLIHGETDVGSQHREELFNNWLRQLTSLRKKAGWVLLKLYVTVTFQRISDLNFKNEDLEVAEENMGELLEQLGIWGIFPYDLKKGKKQTNLTHKN